MSIYDAGSMKTAADVVALMKSMLTPESFARGRSLFPDSRIEEFIEEYLYYDRATGWEDEVFDDPDQQKYVMSEEYWEENFGNDPTYASTNRYVGDLRHGDSDSKFTVGYPEPYEPSEQDLEPEELAARYGEDPAYWRYTKGGKLNSSVQNAHVEQTPQGTWVVKGDSERFGKNAILFEHYSKKGAERYLHKLNKSESAKNMAKSHYRKANLDSASGLHIDGLPKEFEYQVIDHNQMRTIPQFQDAAKELERLCQEAHAEIPLVHVSGMSQAKAAGKNIIFENENGIFRWDESAKKFVPLNSSKGNMRIRTSVNCARNQHAITCLNCAVSEVTVPEDFVRTESRAFDLVQIVQNELWDKGMDVTIKQLYRPKPNTFRFSYIITDPTTTDEQVDAGIEEIVQKLTDTGFYSAYDVDLDSSDTGSEVTDISINLFDNFPRKKLWECMNWLEHEMWAEGWEATVESADQPKPDQISFEVAHPTSISAEDIDDFVKDRVLEFIENDYHAFEYPSTDPRSKYNSSLSCSVDWVSGDGNAFYLVDDGEDDGWGDADEYEDYKVESDEYGNDVVHYEGYTITGNTRIGYVALSPYGTWSPNIYRSITDAVDDVDRDIAAKSQKVG